MSTREYHSASVSYYNAAFVDVSEVEPWKVLTASKKTESSLPCIIMEPDSITRVNPMQRQCGGWDDRHFHPHLRLPMECSLGLGMTVTLQSMARECVTVALSPDASFQLGKTYVVHFGASANVNTVLRRRLPNGTDAIDVSVPSRVCRENEWVDYWVCLTSSGKLYAGIGKLIGQDCIAVLDDSLYHQLRSAVDAVRFVGLGNSALGRNAGPLKVRNVCVTTVPSYLADVLVGLPNELPLVTLGDDAGENQEISALMEEYQKECQKNKARAAKFGIPYVEPSPQAFLQWGQARMLRANPEKGFITGMDITAADEQTKIEARKARFGVDTSNGKRKTDEAGEEGEANEVDAMEAEAEPLPVVEAWDNEALVRDHRKDPPEHMWKNSPPPVDDREDKDEYAMEEAEQAVLLPEKIHIFSTDWAAFKQIRTNDVMAYFRDYGPSYVEWLGELSCNVLFEDKFSAARALDHLSQELPTPPAELTQNTKEGEEQLDPPAFGDMGWRFCRQPVRKIANDRYGRRGTTARLLMRVATSDDVLVERPTSWPAPPPGFSTKRVLGPGSDFDTNPRKKKRRRKERNSYSRPSETYSSSDLGEMGEHPAMERGLQSGRAGFSVEELEAERAKETAVVKVKAPEVEDVVGRDDYK